MNIDQVVEAVKKNLAESRPELLTFVSQKSLYNLLSAVLSSTLSRDYLNNANNSYGVSTNYYFQAMDDVFETIMSRPDCRNTCLASIEQDVSPPMQGFAFLPGGMQYLVLPLLPEYKWTRMLVGLKLEGGQVVGICTPAAVDFSIHKSRSKSEPLQWMGRPNDTFGEIVPSDSDGLSYAEHILVEFLTMLYKMPFAVRFCLNLDIETAYKEENHRALLALHATGVRSVIDGLFETDGVDVVIPTGEFEGCGVLNGEKYGLSKQPHVSGTFANGLALVRVGDDGAIHLVPSSEYVINAVVRSRMTEIKVLFAKTYQGTVVVNNDEYSRWVESTLAKLQKTLRNL